MLMCHINPFLACPPSHDRGEIFGRKQSTQMKQKNPSSREHTDRLYDALGRDKGWNTVKWTSSPSDPLSPWWISFGCLCLYKGTLTFALQIQVSRHVLQDTHHPSHQLQSFKPSSSCSPRYPPYYKMKVFSLLALVSTISFATAAAVPQLFPSISCVAGYQPTCCTGPNTFGIYEKASCGPGMCLPLGDSSGSAYSIDQQT